jgi:DNA-binding NarL/FixJ family response regulator
MFSEGLEACLARTPGLEVVGHAAEPDAALQRILALQPDTVLLITPRSNAPHPWIAGAEFWRANTAPCCIELSLQDNCVHVFRGEQTLVNGLDDLVGLIEQTLVVQPAGRSSQGDGEAGHDK